MFQTQIGPDRFPIGSLCFFAKIWLRNIPLAPESMRALTGMLRLMVFSAPMIVVDSKKNLFLILITSTDWSGIAEMIANVNTGHYFKNLLLSFRKEVVLVLPWEGLDIWLWCRCEYLWLSDISEEHCSLCFVSADSVLRFAVYFWWDILGFCVLVDDRESRVLCNDVPFVLGLRVCQYPWHLNFLLELL